MKNGNTTKQALATFIDENSEKIVRGHCVANALRVWNEFGGEIHEGMANVYHVVDGQRANAPHKQVEHCWNILTVDGKPETIIDAYNLKKTKLYCYEHCESSMSRPFELVEKRVNQSRTNEELAPLVADGIISEKNFSKSLIHQAQVALFGHRIRLAHTTSPACVASIIHCAQFNPTFDNPYTANAGFNCFVQVQDNIPQSFASTGAVLYCDWSGPIQRYTCETRLLCSPDTLWFDSTWRAFVPINSNPNLLKVTDYSFKTESEKNWYFRSHRTVFWRLLFKFTPWHFNRWLAREKQALDDLIERGVWIEICP